jgi:membrane associated rhomboid family serine protease
MRGQVSFGRRGPAAMTRAAVAADVAAPPSAPQDDRAFGRVPWATLALLALLGLAFLLELADAPGVQAKAISLATLIHLGGVSRELAVQDGQVWRLLTAPWLHGGTAHILGNAVALLMFGLLLEPIIGWRWLTAVYALGGLAGSLATITLHAPFVVSVGASGAIMALMGCAAMVSFHPASHDRRKQIWRMCLVGGVPALLPISASSHIDYSAHTGGAVLGIVAGCILVVTWKAHRLRPPLQGAAMAAGLAIGLAGLGALGVAAALPPAPRPNHGTPGLIPADQIPAPTEDGMRQASELVSDYPDDPRGHALMAMAWSKRGGAGAAELELQKALASPLLHAPEIPPDFERGVRVMLLSKQVQQKEFDAARQTAASLCPAAAALDPSVQNALKALRACGAR